MEYGSEPGPGDDDPPPEHDDEPTVPGLPTAATPARVEAHPEGARAHRSPRHWMLLSGKFALALVSLLVLALTGYTWSALQNLSGGMTRADVIDDGSGNVPRPPDGARDILLVGMDSRTDAQGNPLPDEVRNKVLHVGGNDKEHNTDTLILLHIPNDGSKAVAISIPRDSYVEVPGFGKHKVNSAYRRAKSAVRDRLKAEGGHSPRQIRLRSNQAGAQKLVETVELLTGRTIDNYASINLLGFYRMTKAVGGVKVCLKQPVDDRYTDLHLPAGLQTISGKDALGFVRQRHGLPRGDLDRIERQQAFMAGLAREIISAGTLTDPQKLGDLIDAIKKSIVLNKGWDILAFAKQLQDLAGGDIEFYTIPVLRADLWTPTDGIAVKVDPKAVREFIDGLSGTEQTPPPQASTSGQAPDSRTAQQDSDAPPSSKRQPTQPDAPPPSSTASPTQKPMTASGIPCVN